MGNRKQSNITQMNELLPHGCVGEEARAGDKTVLKITKQQRAEAVFVFGKTPNKARCH